MSERASLSAPPLAERAPAPVPARPRPAFSVDHGMDAGRAPAAPSRFAHDFSGVRLRAPAGAVQPKLVVGAPDDAYEREADRVAAAVMDGPEPEVEVTGAAPEGRVQRLCAHCSAEGANDHDETGDEEPVQAWAAPGRTPAVTPAVEAGVDAARGGGHPLDGGLLEFFGSRLGADLRGVRVHTDPPAARAAQALGARAFTRGEHIFFAPGEYAPGTDGGRRLMAHELAHTLQQRAAGPGPAIATLRRTPAPAPWSSGGGGAAVMDAPSAAPASPASAPASANAPAPAGPASTPAPAPASTPSNASAGQMSVAPPAPMTESAAAADAPEAVSEVEGTEASPASAGSPGEMLAALASVPPTSLAGQVTAVSAASSQAHAAERADLAANPPTIAQPTGMGSVAPAAAVGTPTVVGEGQTPGLAPGGPAQGEPVDTRVEEPRAPVPGANQQVAVAEPADDESGSWWDWIFGAVRRFTNSLPTTDPALSTSAGQRPRVDTTGDANPARAEEQQRSSDAEVLTCRAEADAAVNGDFGVSGIAPQVTPGTLRARTGGEAATAAAEAPAGAAPEREAGGAGHPAVRAGVDQAAAAHTRGEVQAAAAREAADRAQMEADSRQERETTREAIATEDARVRGEQLEARRVAVEGVDGRRDAWRLENQQVQATYAGASADRRRTLDTEVNREVTTAETRSAAELASAEERAERERVRVEAEAAAKRREAEAQPRSYWQRIKGAVSSVFNALRRAVTALFDGLRAVVRGIISAAKQLVKGFIELARLAVVGLIRAFGEGLKLVVGVALAAFPDAARRARKWIDDRVDGAVEVVNHAAAALTEFAMAALDALGAALDFILSVYQRAYELLLDALEFLALGLLDILERVGHLVEAASQMPDHFWGQVSAELLGSDVTQPLPFERSGPAPAPATAGAAPTASPPSFTAAPAAGMAPPVGPPPPALAMATDVLTRTPLTASDVEVDSVAPMSLDPAFVASLGLADGGEVDFGHSDDPSRTMASVQADAAQTAGMDAAAPGMGTDAELGAPAAGPAPDVVTGADGGGAPAPEAETQAGAEPAAEGGLPADPQAQLDQLMGKPVEGGCTREKSGEPATQAALPESERVFGPFTAWQRTTYLLHQMKKGISQWFDCNWPYMLAGLIAALAVLVVAEILTGGAITAALPAVMQILMVVMLGVAAVRMASYVGDYLVQGWDAKIAPAAKALARGLAIGAIELIFALIFDMGAILKIARDGVKATLKAAVAATKASVKTLARSGRAIGRAAVRTARNPARAARLVGRVAMRRGRIVMQGVRSGFERGVRSLDDLGNRLLARTRFRRFKLRIKGRRIRLYGYLNPWILLADGTLEEMPTTGGRPELGDIYEVGRRDGFLVGVERAPSQAVAELQGMSQAGRKRLYQQFKSGDKDAIRRHLVNKESTAALRKGIITPQPRGFNAHHIVPRELRTNPAIKSFLDKIGFSWESGARNGVMLPPSRAEALALPDKRWVKATEHFTSHPKYTVRVGTEVDGIRIFYQRQLAKGVPPATAAATANAAMDALTTKLRTRLMSGLEKLD